MPSTRNPEQLHDPVSYGYSHLAITEGQPLVFIAGQYASDTDGHVVSDDFARQVRQSFANLGTALRAAGLDYSDVLMLRTYIVDHDAAKLTALLAAVAELWGAQPPAQTLLGVAALALPDMAFEVDAVAAQR